MDISRPDLTSASPEILAYIETLEAELARLCDRSQPASAAESSGADEAAREAVDPAEPPTTITIIAISREGHVKRTPRHFYNRQRRGGMGIFSPVAACWTPGDGDLFIATRQGLALRFPEKQVPLTGALGIRLEAGDELVGILSVKNDTAVFLLGADGRGTIRLMSGFSANKAPGSGGKTALKTEKLVAALTVKEGDDLFIISRLCKLIRFPAEEIPAKDGVVQGVNCMALRADETVVACASPNAQFTAPDAQL
jgi:DNA gyrase subunit A